DQAATDVRDERSGLIGRAGRKARDVLQPVHSAEDISRHAGEGEMKDQEYLVGADRLEEAEDRNRREVPPAGLGITGERRACEDIRVPARDIERADRLAEVRVPGHVEGGDVEIGETVLEPESMPGEQRSHQQ